MTKAGDLLACLSADWVPADQLCAELEWQPHTLRGAISTLAKKHKLKAERRRLNNITSYRLVDPEYDSNKDVEGSFNDAYAAVRARVAQGGPGWEPK